MRKIWAVLGCYDQAINLNPESGETWDNKGKALKALGYNEEADAAFAKAKELGYDD